MRYGYRNNLHLRHPQEDGGTGFGCGATESTKGYQPDLPMGWVRLQVGHKVSENSNAFTDLFGGFLAGLGSSDFMIGEDNLLCPDCVRSLVLIPVDQREAFHAQLKERQEREEEEKKRKAEEEALKWTPPPAPEGFDPALRITYPLDEGILPVRKRFQKQIDEGAAFLRTDDKGIHVESEDRDLVGSRLFPWDLGKGNREYIETRAEKEEKRLKEEEKRRAFEEWSPSTDRPDEWRPTVELHISPMSGAKLYPKMVYDNFKRFFAQGIHYMRYNPDSGEIVIEMVEPHRYEPLKESLKRWLVSAFASDPINVQFEKVGLSPKRTREVRNLER